LNHSLDLAKIAARNAHAQSAISESARRHPIIHWKLTMRLTEEQRKIIREAGLRHFGVIPYLFGSRLNPTVRGGDIDLFIPGDWSPREAIPRRLRFCAELHRRLGEQKIDVVVENQATPSSIQNQAAQQGAPV
jgi:hypothetical protein